MKVNKFCYMLVNCKLTCVQNTRLKSRVLLKSFNLKGYNAGMPQKVSPLVISFLETHLERSINLKFRKKIQNVLFERSVFEIRKFSKRVRITAPQLRDKFDDNGFVMSNRALRILTGCAHN